VKTMPNDGELVDFFAKVVPDKELRKRILVDNPRGFIGRTRKLRGWSPSLEGLSRS